MIFISNMSDTWIINIGRVMTYLTTFSILILYFTEQKQKKKKMINRKWFSVIKNIIFF